LTNNQTNNIPHTPLLLKPFNANLDGTHFSVLVNNLQPGREYHYCYEVDYGFSKPYKTETKTFATPI